MGRVLAVVAVAVVASSAAPSAEAKPACRKQVGDAPAGLPAPVVLRSVCGSYTVQPDGRVAVSKPAPLRAAGVQVRKQRGHVVVVSEGRVVWRSQRVFAGRAWPDGVVGAAHVAFSFYGGRLWVAALTGPERPVARHQDPIGWTRNEELLTAGWGRHTATLYVHGRRGRVIATDVRSPFWDASTATLLFVSADGVLIRTDGRAMWPLVVLSSLGLGRGVSPQPAGAGLIVLPGRDRLVVLRADGSLFASSFFPAVRRRGGWLAFDAWPAAGANGVAFTIAEYDDYALAYENVFVLREGATDAARLLRTEVGYTGCGWWANLAWHGEWLLYTASAATQVVALDTAGGHAVELTAFARSLPGVVVDQDGQGSGFVDAAWND